MADRLGPESSPSPASTGHAQEPCPICGGSSPFYYRKHAYEADWDLHRCTRCAHGFVRNRPTMEALSRIYATDTSHHPTDESGGDENGTSDCRSLAATVERLLRSGGRRSLDVGSGDGRFTRELAKRGFQPVLIDLDPRSEKAAAQIPGATFFLSAFEELLDPGPYDVIVMSQVLEHALDPLDWLRRAGRLLRPGGVLAVAVPNFAGVYRILGARDPFLIPPIHLNFFTAASLRLAFESAGLQTRKVDSRSEISVGGGSAARRAIGRTWNAVSWVMNPSRFGIILRGFASRRE